MADGSTANLGYELPEVGASDGTWGTKNNNNWSKADAHPGIKLVADQAAREALTPFKGQVVMQLDTATLYKCTNATGPVWDVVGHGAIPLTTKGDLLVYGSALARLGVGADGYVLTADAAQALGVKWAAAAGGGGGIAEATFSKPAIADFAISRAGTATFSDTTKGIRMVAPGTGDDVNSLCYLLKAITEGTAGYRVTARIRRYTPLENYMSCGILLRNSSDGKSVTFEISKVVARGLHTNLYSSDTAAQTIRSAANHEEYDLWLRIHDNLTTRKMYISRYGDYWQEVYSDSHDNHIAPDQAGIFINPNMAGNERLRSELGAEFYSFQLESLNS